MLNPYEMLGLGKDCTDEDITKAFRNLSKLHHPDVGGDTDEFVKIQLAVAVLRDPYKRKMYDDYGIFDGMSADSTHQLVMEKFGELIESWLSNARYARDILGFFELNITAAKKKLEGKIQDNNKEVVRLNNRKKNILVKDGEKNFVHEVINAKIVAIDSQTNHLQQEMVVVDRILEEAIKYSSESEDEDEVTQKVTYSETYRQLFRGTAAY